MHVSVHTHKHSCMCVCGGGVNDQRESGKKCEKGIVKEGEKLLSASVTNRPSTIVHG